MSDLFDDLDFEMLGGDFEDPFENEPVDPMPPPVPGMPNVSRPGCSVVKWTGGFVGRSRTRMSGGRGE